MENVKAILVIFSYPYQVIPLSILRLILSLICFKCLRLTKKISPLQVKQTMVPAFSYCEALQILKNIPDETRKRLSAKSYYPQSGLIMQCLPVPPNCLSVPSIFDGVAKMPADLSVSMLLKVLQKIETIKRCRSGSQNFESHEIEANELQLVVAKYMDLRGTTQEVLLCKTKFIGSKKQNDKCVILFLNYCPCGKIYCQENAAYTVQNHLRGLALKDLVSEFIIEYQKQMNPEENTGTNAGLVGHIHLNEKKLMELQCGLDVIHEYCQELVNFNSKGRKKFAQLFKRVHIFSSGSCSLLQSDVPVPCLRYFNEDETGNRSIKEIQGIMADVIWPVLLNTVVKG